MIPNQCGMWFHKPTNQQIEVYLLEPANTLCMWGPEVGITYSGAVDTQGCWETDEWQGHVPVFRFDDNPYAWQLINPM